MNDIVKALLFAFVFLGILLLIVYLLFFSSSLSKFIDLNFQWTEKGIDLEKFNQTPENYLNKEVRINGVFNSSLEIYKNCSVAVNKLMDKDGNQIKICSTRKFEEGVTYSLKGRIIKSKSNTTGKEDYLFREDSFY